MKHGWHFTLHKKNGAYANEPIMQLFEQEVAPRVLDWDLLEKKIMTPNAEAIQALPEPFQSLYQTL